MRRKLLICSGEAKKVRSSKGNFLIEAVVAVLVSSVFAGALVSSLSQGMSVTNGAQGQLMAAAMAQEVLDSARVMNWTTLQGMAPGSPYALTVQLQAGGGPVACPPYPRALLLDNQNFTYGTFVDNGNVVNKSLKNTFTAATCNATETIIDNGDNTLTVNVTINWRDSQGNHSHTTGTRLARFGIGGS